MKQLITALCLGLSAAGLFGVQSDAQAANLSLNPGTTATSNSEFGASWSASKAIDGDPTSNWSASGWSDPNNPYWLLVDLGAAYQVSSVVLKSRDLEQYGPSYYIDYEFLVSNDQSTWWQLKTGRLTDDAGDAWWDEVTVNASMRYAAFQVTGGTHWAHLYEMEINGENPVQVPEPATVSLIVLALAGLAFQRGRRGRREA